MKKSVAIFFQFITAVLLFSACTKVDDLPFYEEGQAVTLTSDKTSVSPTLADSNNAVVKFTWTDPKYSADAGTFKYVIEIDTAGNNFADKFTKTVTGKFSDSLTGRDLNSILLNFGYAVGVPHKLDIRVVSSYGNNNERYLSNTVSLTVTPFVDPSKLTSSSTNIIGTLATQGQTATTFSWTPSFPGYSGAINYVLEFDSAGKNFASAQTMAVGTGLTKTLTIGEVNAMALNEGIAGGATGKIEYRIKATTAQGAVAYSNVVPVTIQAYIPFYRMYIVGSVNGWDINNPWEIISDKAAGRWGKVFYTYAKLNAGDAFLFVKTPGDWNSKHGSTGGSGAVHDIGAPGSGGDFVVPTAGIYRLTIDLNANKVYIQPKQVGVVGNMQGWDPANPIYGGLVKRDQFLIITPSSGTDAFKFHDGPAWDNSAPDKARWWGRGASAGLLDIDGTGPDLIANTSPRTRAIWDGTDPQSLKYDLSPAAEMRVVGDGIDQAGVNDWDPPTSPQMTYTGNGVWTISITLKANKSIKFLAGNAWGAFDYEDASGGATSTGSPRAISWTGGPDFKTPTTAGTYTIILNEYTQTVTIN